MQRCCGAHALVAAPPGLTFQALPPLDGLYSGCLYLAGMTKFDKFCNWPMHYDDVSEFMTGLNDARIGIVEKHGKEKTDVITFSHFLPRQERPAIPTSPRPSPRLP